MRLVLILMGSFLLTACAGFSPMYGKGSKARIGLEQVQMSQIQGRAGFVLMQDLEKKAGIRQGNAGNYQLEIDLQRASRGYSIRVDQVATRYDVSVTANWKLLDGQGNVLEKMTASGSSSYSDASDPYAAQVAATAAENRALDLLSDSIIEQLGFYFSKPQPAPDQSDTAAAAQPNSNDDDLVQTGNPTQPDATSEPVHSDQPEPQ